MHLRHVQSRNNELESELQVPRSSVKVIRNKSNKCWEDDNIPAKNTQIYIYICIYTLSIYIHIRIYIHCMIYDIYEDDNKPSQPVFLWEFLLWWKSVRTNQNGMLLVGFGTNDHLFIYGTAGQQLSGKVCCRKRFPLNAVDLGVCFNVFLGVATQEPAKSYFFLTNQ